MICMSTKYEVHILKTVAFMFANYSYIVVDTATKAALVVDPAWEIDKITKKLYELDAHLEAILLTHSHHDHVNLVNPLVKRFSPRVYMSKTEIDYYGFRCNNLYALNDMDEINVGETRVSCLHTPGHTAGGMCYLLEDSIFTGDTIFTEGCGICNTDGGSAEQMFESIQRVKSIVTPDFLVYPGHSYGKAPGKTIDYLMEWNIYFQFETIEYFVDFRMRKNQKGLFRFK